MKQKKIFKIIAVISYLLIILMGDIIGLPLVVWLLFTLFDFGNANQLFALLAIIGLAICLMKLNSIPTLKIVLLDIVSFLLLSSPIIKRLTDVSIEKFNYLTFIIPVTIFITFYSLSVFYSFKQVQKSTRSYGGFVNLQKK